MSNTTTIQPRRGNGLAIANLLVVANVLVFGWVGYEMLQFGKVSASLYKLAGREIAAPGTIDFRSQQPAPEVTIQPTARDWMPIAVAELPEVQQQLAGATEPSEDDWRRIAELVSDRSLPTALRNAWLLHWVELPPVSFEDTQELIQFFQDLAPNRSGLPTSTVTDLASHWMSAEDQSRGGQTHALRQVIFRLDPTHRAIHKPQPIQRRGVTLDTSPTPINQAAAINPSMIADAFPNNRSRQSGRQPTPQQNAQRWLATLKQPEGYGRFVADIQTAGTDDPAVAQLITAANNELSTFNLQPERSLSSLPAWVDRVAIACGDVKLFASLRETVSKSEPIEGARSVDRWIGVALADGDPRWAKTLLEALPDTAIPPRWQNHQVALQADPWWADLAAAISFLAGDDQSFIIERLTDETPAGRIARQTAIDQPSWSPELIKAVASGLGSADSDRPDRWQWLGHAWPDTATRQKLAESIPDDLDWSLWSMIAPVLPPQAISETRWKQAAERGVLPMLLMPLLIDSQPIDWPTIVKRLDSLPAGSVFAEGNHRLDWAVALRILRFVAVKEKLPPEFDQVAARCGSSRTQAVLERLTKLPGSTLSPDDSKAISEQIKLRSESRKGASQ